MSACTCGYDRSPANPEPPNPTCPQHGPDDGRRFAVRVEPCRMVSPRVCGPCGRDAGHDGPHRSTGDTFTAYWSAE